MAATLVLFLLLSSLVVAASDLTSGCPSYKCGDAVDIHYPFWVDHGNGAGGASNSYRCGYPSLRLECRRGTPVLRLPSGDYGIRRITYGDTLAGDRTVSIFDLGVFKDSTCPHVAGRTLTLPPGSPPLLSLTDHNTNVTFYTNCTFVGTPSHEVPCLASEDGRNHTYVLRDNDYPMPYAVTGLCDGTVVFPVLLQSMANSEGRLEDVMEALKTGFELRWRPAVGGVCGDCESSGGFCGIAKTADGASKFKCFGMSATPSKSSVANPAVPDATP